MNCFYFLCLPVWIYFCLNWQPNSYDSNCIENELKIDIETLNSQKNDSIYENSSFEIKAKLNLGSGYTGCGVMQYTICIDGILTEPYQKIMYGDKALFYITCPDIYNGLPYADCYLIRVEIYQVAKSNGAIICSGDSFNDETLGEETKFKVLEIRALK